ncbi:MAG: AAA family ATPase [Thermoflavifilum sp.]|nr:AAA family ATPase [Thermoflavifilum sp.]MCL6514943.1 AAA family ATPase [Alicyclobacillus sp.]
MKKLTRMLLINWHYFVHELLEFDDVTFLTGKNGAGKSTILDAMQLVILGDTTGHYFNKAANDQSKRTLRGYLRGEVGEDDSGRVMALREGQFTSYLVLEFAERRSGRFCIGAVFDTFPDGSYDHRFFWLGEALPEDHFIHDGVPLDIPSLSRWGARRRNRFELFTQNKAYQQMLLTRFGNVREKFFRLFRKAVPFNPIMDVAGFISEFVCDAPTQVDIEDMRENIRHYRRMEQELEHVRKRVEALQAISAKYEEWQTVRGRMETYRYLLDRADVGELEAGLADARHKEEELRETYARQQDEIQRLEETYQALQARRDELHEALVRSDVYARRKELEQRRQLVESQFEQVRRAGERADALLADHVLRWRTVAAGVRDAMRWFPAASIPDSLGEALRTAADLLAQGLEVLPQPGGWRELHLRRAAQAAALPSPPAVADAEQAWTDIAGAHQHLADGERELRRLLTAWRDEEQRLAVQIRELEQGIKQYPAMVLELQRTLREHFQARGLHVPVEIFADLLEVRDPAWQAAIEGYLHTQRFYLLVPPEHFTEALRVYEALGRERRLYDVGLVDVEKVMAQHPSATAGSLAEEIETDHPYARAYADYLLGRVIKCDDVASLRQHRTSITRTGMLYQNFVARQLNPERWATLYIGKRAVRQQLEQARRRQQEVQKALALWRPRHELWRGWTAQPVPSPSELELVREAAEEVGRAPEHVAQWQEVERALSQLDLTALERIQEELRQCELDLKRADQARQQANAEAVRTEERLRTLTDQQIPQLARALEEKREAIAMRYEPQFVAETGEPRYQQELARLGGIDTLRYNFGRQLAADETRATQYQRQLVELRAQYNRDFLAGHDVQREDNGAYEQELRWLLDTRLSEYESKIREAKERAQVQFKEDFVSKLRTNIETVKMQIDELNHAISGVSFGRDKYRFTVRPNPQYQHFYQMIMDDLLLEGYGLFSQTFTDKHGETIEELFRNIVDVDESDPAAAGELERNLQKFTDYRTYLEFDLVQKDEEGRESRLSRVIAKKSGGETQTPFYISVLASFAQLYRVNRPGLDDTVRLIIFDEAYSKMDHQRIRQSIRLIRQLGLQVVLCAPTEKIADIAPMVDRTLVVTRIQRETRVSPYAPPKHEVAR